MGEMGVANSAVHRRDGSGPRGCPARRIGKVFSFLGLSVGVVTSETPRRGKIEAFEKDVTYITGGPLPAVRRHGPAGAAWHACRVLLKAAVSASGLRRLWLTRVHERRLRRALLDP